MKKLITIGLIGALLTMSAGCTPLKTSTTMDNEDTNSISNTTEDTRNTTDDYTVGEVITIGEIMAFAGDSIHIISGDIVEVFKYDSSTAENFYIGQTVQLIKGETNDHLQAFEKEDYAISHTNMGYPIEQLVGEITTIDTEKLTIENSEGSFTIDTYETVEGQIGDTVTVYTMAFDTRLSAIMVLNEASKLSLEIMEISRLEDGKMIVLAKDADGGEYTLNPSAVAIELDMSNLAVGDTLTVYHKGIMESWPMQLDTILIRK